MYKAVVQVILPFGKEIWVMMGLMMTVLEGLHQMIARRAVVMISSKENSREW